MILGPAAFLKRIFMETQMDPNEPLQGSNPAGKIPKKIIGTLLSLLHLSRRLSCHLHQKGLHHTQPLTRTPHKPPWVCHGVPSWIQFRSPQCPEILMKYGKIHFYVYLYVYIYVYIRVYVGYGTLL